MNLYAETAMIWHKNKSNSNGNARIKKKRKTRVQRTTFCEISADSRKTHLLCFVASLHILRLPVVSFSMIFDLCKSNKNYYNEGADMADGQSKKHALREIAYTNHHQSSSK